MDRYKNILDRIHFSFIFFGNEKKYYVDRKTISSPFSFAISLLKKLVALLITSSVGSYLLKNLNIPLPWSSNILYVPPIQPLTLPFNKD